MVDAMCPVACSQDKTLLQHMQKSDQKTPAYFVKISAEFQWPCCETGAGTPLSSSLESGSPPTLLKQLVELEFFGAVAGAASDGVLSRPPSEVEQALGNTLVPAQTEMRAQRPTPSPNFASETSPLIGSDNELVDFSAAAVADRSPEVCVVDAADEVPLRDGTGGGPPVVADDAVFASDVEQNVRAGLPRDVSTGAFSDADRPLSTRSSALSVELSASDVDSETFPLVADSELVDGLTDGFCGGLASFAGRVLQSRLLSTAALMNIVHRRCLDTMISVAFDMAWDVICTPTRIKFARTKEVPSCVLLSLCERYSLVLSAVPM